MARKTLLDERNILDSDGTLIITENGRQKKSDPTVVLCRKHDRPFVRIDLSKVSVPVAARIIKTWLKKSNVKVLNVVCSCSEHRDRKLLSLLPFRVSISNKERRCNYEA